MSVPEFHPNQNPQVPFHCDPLHFSRRRDDFQPASHCAPMSRHGQGHGGSDCKGPTCWAPWRLWRKEDLWWESEASYLEGSASNRERGAIEASDRWYVMTIFAPMAIAEMIWSRTCPWGFRPGLPKAARQCNSRPEAFSPDNGKIQL